jgi:hypothetical protein
MPKGAPMQQHCPAPSEIPSGAAALVAEGGDAALRRLDPAIANCSRRLLDSTPEEDAVSQALADLVYGLDAAHAALFQIKSYHMEDYRGQWLACSAGQTCGACREIREWDYLRLIDAEMRTRLAAGKSCRLGTPRLPADFSRIFVERGVGELLVMPLAVMGQWWGCLCIEKPHGEPTAAPADACDLATLAALFSIYYERRQAVQGCQEREKLSGALEMAGTVCHKLNQPMQVILGYASMVTSGDIRDPAQIGEIVQLIEDETRQMGIITKNLMGITKQRRTA